MEKYIKEDEKNKNNEAMTLSKNCRYRKQSSLF